MSGTTHIEYKKIEEQGKLIASYRTDMIDVMARLKEIRQVMTEGWMGSTADAFLDEFKGVIDNCEKDLTNFETFTKYIDEQVAKYRDADKRADQIASNIEQAVWADVSPTAMA